MNFMENRRLAIEECLDWQLHGSYMTNPEGTIHIDSKGKAPPRAMYCTTYMVVCGCSGQAEIRLLKFVLETYVILPTIVTPTNFNFKKAHN